jgi:hypothetical protein
MAIEITTIGYDDPIEERKCILRVLERLKIEFENKEMPENYQVLCIKEPTKNGSKD